jgi:hypothetical protein
VLTADRVVLGESEHCFQALLRWAVQFGRLLGPLDRTYRLARLENGSI